MIHKKFESKDKVFHMRRGEKKDLAYTADNYCQRETLRVSAPVPGPRVNTSFISACAVCVHCVCACV